MSGLIGLHAARSRILTGENTVAEISRADEQHGLVAVLAATTVVRWPRRRLYMRRWRRHRDLSVGLAIPHLAAEIPAMLRQLLGLAPSTKVVYSRDASQIPELFWLAARWGRRGLAAVLDELIALGALDGDEAIAVGRRVLVGNAAGIYGLPWP